MPFQNLANEFANVARQLASQPSHKETLQAIVECAARTIDGADCAGITVRRDNGKFLTAASTDPVVKLVDALQYETRPDLRIQVPAPAAAHEKSSSSRVCFDLGSGPLSVRAREGDHDPKPARRSHDHGS